MTGVACLSVMNVSFYSHTSTVLVTCGHPGAVVAERPRLRDRLAVHWRARRLDRALAQGIAPETSAALALRAQRLTEADRRWSLAGALRRIVRDVEADRAPRPGRVAPHSHAVVAASDQLTELADTLDDPGPVQAQGVAQAWLLLTDGTGPLFNPNSSDPLSVRAAQAARHLRPWAA
jgi:hypothetical protein